MNSHTPPYPSFLAGLVGSEGAWGRYEFDPLGFSKKTELVPYFREARGQILVGLHLSRAKRLKHRLS